MNQGFEDFSGGFAEDQVGGGVEIIMPQEGRGGNENGVAPGGARPGLGNRRMQLPPAGDPGAANGGDRGENDGGEF